jgi:hypothetical protein
MITTDELTEIFHKKLAETGSLDQAFKKAVWVAYQRGLAEGKDTDERQTSNSNS